MGKIYKLASKYVKAVISDEVITPVKPEKENLKPKMRTKVDYEMCLRFLEEYGGFFLPEVSRQVAWYVKRVLSRRTGRAVEAAPFVMKSGGRLVEGYLIGFADKK